MLPLKPVEEHVGNHPYAIRMAVIAFFNWDVPLACLWGSFSVLLGTVETRLHVGRELSTLAIPAVNLSASLLAPIFGIMAARYSLKLLLMSGSLLTFAGYVLLACSHSYLLYIVAFGFLLGPGMAACFVLPTTLVTRWYAINRGRTLGLVSMPFTILFVPLAATWMLQTHGPVATYVALATLSLLPVAANFFIIDYPPTDAAAAATADDDDVDTVGVGTVGVAQLLSSTRYWALVIGYVSMTAASTVFSAHMVPMVKSWGMSPTLGASLLTAQTSGGVAGAIVYGWLADRIGGALTLGFITLSSTFLWLMLLLHPPFVVLAIIIGVFGMGSAGTVPAVGVALTEAFGREGFSRAYGLVSLVVLPFYVVSVPAAALIFTRTGSYNDAILGVAAFLAIGGMLSISAVRRVRQPATLELAGSLEES